MTAGLVALAALWLYLGYTRAPRPRQAHPVRMIVYFVGLLVIASALADARVPVLHLPDHRVLPRHGAAAVAAAHRRRLRDVGPRSTPDRRVPDEPGVVDRSTWRSSSSRRSRSGSARCSARRLAEQSEQRRLAVARLEAALEENAGLHAQLLTQAREAGVLDERQRMAREIHDTIAQGLTGIVTQLEAAEQARDRPEDWQRHVENAHRPGPREPVRGAAVGRGLAARAPRDGTAAGGARRGRPRSGRRSTASRSRSTTTGDVQPLHPEIEVALLRTAQEALANVAKHARASRAGLTLSYMGDVVTLDVRDDGVGFEVPATRPSTRAAAGFGLTAMRQRVEPRGRDARDRVRAGRRHGRLGARAGDRARPGWSAAAVSADPPADRRRPPGRARRPARDVRRRPRVRGRRRGGRRGRGGRARRAPATRT